MRQDSLASEIFEEKNSSKHFLIIKVSLQNYCLKLRTVVIYQPL